MSSIFEGGSSEEESTSTSQNGNKIDNASPTLLLFDIDGVITEPVTGKVALDVVDEIVGALERGEPIAFNTGRGLKWVFQDIVPPIRHKLSSKSILSKLCIAHEKGAFLLTFNEQGEPEKPVVTPEIDFVPLFLRMEVLELITTKYSATMFPGEEKEAILSPQFQPGSDFTKYKEDQERLVADLHSILQRHRLDTRFRVDPTRIATDIEDIRLGKALGTRRILEWLADKRIQSEYFIAFGDSKSDIGMAQEIHSHGFPVEMVFVGGKEQLKDIRLPFIVIFTQAHCEKGTGEYFRGKVQNVPKFNGGSFTIEFLSPSAKGFEVRTRQTLLRHEPNTPLPEAARIRDEREKEVKEFRIGPGFVPIVGIRKPEQIGSVLTFDIQPVTFSTYRAIGNPSERPEALAISNPTGTASVLLTSEPDGSHKIILQHRPPESFFYSDVPGASIAGMLDGKLDLNNRGRLEPITTGVIMANNRKEMFEELGLDPDDIADVRITGVAKDNVRIHNEFLLFGISPLSAREITAKAAIHAKIKKGDAEYDFPEKVFVIDGTPEAIEILLTQVRCPLPPTHAAAFVAAGYSMVRERRGEAAADQWKQYLQQDIQANYRDIDQRVAAYWRQRPEKAEICSANKPARSIHGYDPAYRPTDQGLPDITEELQRVGLITRESPAASEIKKTLDS